jgi:hypothetical protein
MAALAAAALSFIALPGAAAAYPPEPPQQSVDVESVTVVCVGPTPYIEYELTTEGFDQPEDLTATDEIDAAVAAVRTASDCARPRRAGCSPETRSPRATRAR